MTSSGLMNDLLARFFYFWHFPGFRLVAGVLLLGAGILYLQFPEAKIIPGILVTVLGLAILLDAVSGGTGFVTTSKPVVTKAVEQPSKPPSYMRIEVGPQPASSGS